MRKPRKLRAKQPINKILAAVANADDDLFRSLDNITTVDNYEEDMAECADQINKNCDVFTTCEDIECTFRT